MATAITRWDPAADFAAMRTMMDRLFDQPFPRLPFRNGEELGTASLSLDVVENGDTYVIKAAVPGVDRWRPLQETSIPNLILAGDWTQTGWPATMEGAVRSGYLAAEAILRRCGRPERLVQPDL